MTASQARPDVFTVHYVLKNKIGELVDTSEGSEPLHFVYGSPEIIEGIQQAVKDRNVGDCLEVTVPPAMAYGLYFDLEIVGRREATEDEVAQGRPLF